ncbi:MAG TPA: hypothetical protein VG898_08790, partial [Solirubrobacterales bacterium]|nr:hypothetical protein [Solirubrobacterales bacterium]
MVASRAPRLACLPVLPALCAVAIVAPGPAAAAGPPLVGAAWSSGVTARSAELHAAVNPNGLTTTYRFQYLSAPAYEANLAASRDPFSGAQQAPGGAGASLGAGSGIVEGQQHVAGLAPGSAYRYRLLAVNSAASSVTEALTLVTEQSPPPAPLLDARGWEMVSPSDKNGGEVEAPGQAAAGLVQAATAGGAIAYGSTASFGPDAAGAPWTSQYVSRRGGAGWATQNITQPTLSGSFGEQPGSVPYQLFSTDLARALVANGGRCEAGESCPRGYSLRDGASGVLTASPEAPDLRLAGASADLRHAVLSTCAALTPWATEAPGAEGCDTALPNLYGWSPGAGALLLLNLLPSQATGTPGASLAAGPGAVSGDGFRVYFTLAGDLYLREAGATKLVAAGGSFQVAATDGSVAFYTTPDGHLHRYKAAGAGSSADLTPAGGVVGVLAASENGSHLYYATGSGLFLWHAGATRTVASGAGAAAPSDYPPATATARTSADGTRLAFLSRAPLSGYDNIDQASGQPDSEVFLYDAGSGELLCASCNPTGERPRGPAAIPGSIATGSGEAAASYRPRALSADGRRLFFDSGDSLLPQDSNATTDVYEWEAPGVGGCSRPAGCLGLISSGRSAEPSSFLDASADGTDAFFLTSESLVPSDPGSADLYDARAGGGFPLPVAPIACEGDACQPLPPPPP